MKKINFTDKIDKYKDKRIKQLNNKEIRIIAETVKIMIEKNTKLLTAEDYNLICLSVYRKLNLSNRIKVYHMVNNVEMKEKINDKLIDYYISKGIDVNSKIIELTTKSESLISSTKDALSVARFYKEILDENKNIQGKITEKHTYNSFDSFKSNKPDKIEQEMEIMVGNSNENEGGMGATAGGGQPTEKP